MKRMKTILWEVASVSELCMWKGCEREICHSRYFCLNHRQKVTGEGKKCSTESCDNDRSGSSLLCEPCRHIERRGKQPTCSKDMCSKVAYRMGLCAEHYKEDKTKRGVVRTTIEKGNCPWPLCKRQIQVSGSCDSHNNSRKKYSVDLVDVSTMFESQSGRCLLCECLFSFSFMYVIDHDHSCCPGDKSCGKCVRGLLHKGCNMFEGNLTKLVQDSDIPRSSWVLDLRNKMGF